MGSWSATTLSDSQLDAAWSRLRVDARIALIPYLTAGYPSRMLSLEAIRAADTIGDLLELGVPFSDPLADGPTIQRSTFAALKHGMTLRGTLELIEEAAPTKPVIIFSYLNPILRYGVERFLRDAARLRVAGLLLTDVPAGSDPALEDTIHRSPLDLIRLVAPTTRPERLAAVTEGARGFIYLVARLGVTGATPSLAGDLADSVRALRAVTDLPIAVGFGISTSAQVRTVAGLADGVVVGSALVDRLGREGVSGAQRFLQELRSALDQVETARGG